MQRIEEDISDDLLQGVPELDGGAPLAFTLVQETNDAAAPGDPPLPTPAPFMPAAPMNAPLNAPSSPPLNMPRAPAEAPTGDVHSLVAGARAQMSTLFETELTRVEASFTTLLQQMEQRLAQAQLELAAVRAEHEKIRVETDKKASALRELKKTLEGI